MADDAVDQPGGHLARCPLFSGRGRPFTRPRAAATWPTAPYPAGAAGHSHVCGLRPPGPPPLIRRARPALRTSAGCRGREGPPRQGALPQAGRRHDDGSSPIGVQVDLSKVLDKRTKPERHRNPDAPPSAPARLTTKHDAAATDVLGITTLRQLGSNKHFALAGALVAGWRTGRPDSSELAPARCRRAAKLGEQDHLLFGAASTSVRPNRGLVA